MQARKTKAIVQALIPLTLSQIQTLGRDIANGTDDGSPVFQWKDSTYPKALRRVSKVLKSKTVADAFIRGYVHGLREGLWVKRSKSQSKPKGKSKRRA